MKKAAVWIIALCLVLCFAGSAFAGDAKTIKGLITTRTSDVLSLKTADGNQDVTLTDSTKVQSPKGLGLRKQQMSWASLIPGLKVSVKGALDAGGKFIAEEITFSKDDLQTASMIQAGLTPTEQKVDANKQSIGENKENIDTNKQQIDENQQAVNKRFDDLTDFDVKKEAVVYFVSGKSSLAAADKKALTDLAAEATKLTGYIIEVKGFADSTGNAAMNQTLSKDRAFAVVNFLMQDCSVPPRHIVSPGAMGISNPVASNETATGRKENRRVEVKVMVNKGLSPAGN
ncbi:outer membrane protein, OmpA/MotB family [Candidatus Koribacter versatilis Ellin345]|uniref:Outer membrane protein, OmpA/MotB family n=1 Tax=Koribacter versatilis (strain Ellin345) TaxID=204669 RepID=Q1IQX4_KORVE|nr:OmpA family protein [Candidatus Koribacter versatilis]ABF40726.1 outer membrane protein, OmpA/MotB family [Candidatus Koribacter versatilis Ellin345]